MNLIPFDELIEIWVRVHEETSSRLEVLDVENLSWWREAYQYLRPTDESSAQDAPGSSS